VDTRFTIRSLLKNACRSEISAESLVTWLSSIVVRGAGLGLGRDRAFHIGVGIQPSQWGRYQLRSPRKAIALGSTTERMRVASSRGAMAIPKPICWNMTRSPRAKPAKTATMINAALRARGQ
jgi:hypothetical protein